MKRRYRLLALLLTLLLPGGCAPSLRLDERLILRGLALDHADDWTVTAQCYAFGEEEPWTFHTASAADLPGALTGLQEASGRRPLYAELAVILLGEGVWRQHLDGAFSGLLTQPEIRVGTPVMAAKGEAAALLRLGQGSADSLCAAMEARLSQPICRAARLYSAVGRLHGAGQDLLLPLAGTEGAGKTAVCTVDRVVCFRQDTAAVTLSRQESETLGWLLGGASAGETVWPETDGRWVLRPLGGQRTVRFEDTDPLVCQMTLTQRLSVLPVRPGDPTPAGEQTAALTADRQARAAALLERVLRRAGSDVFSLGLSLRYQQPRLWRELGEDAAAAVRRGRIDLRLDIRLSEG